MDRTRRFAEDDLRCCGDVVGADVLTSACDEIERLRGALAYYASKSHWEAQLCANSMAPPCIYGDRGKLARETLGGEHP